MIDNLAPTQNENWTWLRRGTIPGLDGVRAVAVALVIVAHISQTARFPLRGVMVDVARHGAIGVDIFFVLSGFLITTLLLRERIANGRISLKGFYARRARRILPAYVFYLLVLALLQSCGAISLMAKDWASAATYTVNFLHSPSWEVGHVWSLSIEEHFYLLWPLALVLAGFARSVPILVAVIITAALSRWVILLFIPQYSPMTDAWTFTRIDTIATGCLLAVIVRNENWRARLNRITDRKFSTASIAGLLIGSVLLSSSGKYSVGVAPTVNGILISCLLWTAIVRSSQGDWTILTHSIVVKLGVMSYSIYLWQQLFLNPHSVHWFTVFPQNVALAFIAAYFSNRVVENRFRRTKPSSVPVSHHRVETAALTG